MRELHKLRCVAESGWHFSGFVDQQDLQRTDIIPLHLDKENMVLTDQKGRQFQITSFTGDAAFVIARIEERIEELKRREPIAYGARLTTTAEDLDKLHVKQLLGLLRLHQRRDQINWYHWRAYDEELSEQLFPLFNENDVRTALAKKPHVPNKQEAKALRRERAKRKT